MKILFISDLYPVKDSEKRTPRTLSNFVSDWKNDGHEVDVIKPNFMLNAFLRKKPFYKQGNYNGVLNLNFWTPFWGEIKQPAKNYDVVIAHMPSGILYADKINLPFVAGIHNSDLTVLTNPLYKFHFKKRMEKALENAKAIACRSFALKEKFLQLYPQFENKTFTAPSGIKEEIIVKRTPLQNPNKIKVLTCANYKKSKNIEKVLQATNGIDTFELTVIGLGTDTKKLRKLNPQAIFKGYQPHEKVLEAMRGSDIFILPSKGETFGMVYLEAMASGCITVCSEKDGIDGIIKNKVNGFTTKTSTDEIRNLLLTIKNLNTESLKVLSENSFRTIQQYTNKLCSRNYLQQIFKIL